MTTLHNAWYVWAGLVVFFALVLLIERIYPERRPLITEADERLASSGLAIFYYAFYLVALGAIFLAAYFSADPLIQLGSRFLAPHLGATVTKVVVVGGLILVSIYAARAVGLRASRLERAIRQENRK